MRGDVNRFDYLGTYCEDLVNALNLEAIRDGRSAHRRRPDGRCERRSTGATSPTTRHRSHRGQPEVDPQFAFMTLDTDGKIRMDCSSPNAMAS